MDTIQTAMNMMSEKCFMGSIDLKDAYYSINVKREFRKYFTFIWKGKFMRYKRMPNGLSSAPRNFTKLFKPVFAHLRREGVNIMGYIDDIFIVHESEHTCRLHIVKTIALLERLGFVVNKEKSVLKPVQIMEHLGFKFDSRLMIIKVTDEKKSEIALMSKELLKQRNGVRIRKVAQFVGGTL